MGFGDAAAHVNAATLDLGCQAMFDRVLHQRLKQHTGNHRVQRSSVELFHDSQFVPSEANHFNVQIVIDEFQFFAKGNEGVAAAQQSSQNICQLDDEFARGIRIKPHQ